VGYDWTGTKAGQHGSVDISVQEDGGMPYIHFDPGDLDPVVMARCLEVIVELVVVREAARLATEEVEPDGHVG
jgi:hypothetical protein